jgi:hypothetical protein
MALTDGILSYWNLDNDGSGGVSLVDSTGNGNTLTNNLDLVTLGTGIIGGDAVFNGTAGQNLSGAIFGTQNSYSIGIWLKWDGDYATDNQTYYSSVSDFGIQLYFNQASGNIQVANYGSSPQGFDTGVAIPTDGNWHYYVATQDSEGNFTFYLDQSVIYTNTFAVGSILPGYTTGIGSESNSFSATFNGQIDEVGTWTRALSPSEVTSLWNGGAGNSYPFSQTPTSPLYYNNAQSDGDWGNLLNWWQDSGFTVPAIALPTANDPIDLYNEVTQNTQGADQCFCSSGNFWSANFGAGLTLQATGVVNMQGNSILAGTTTDGVSMHDSSQISATGVVDGNVTMRDSSRNLGHIIGNAYVYYDGGNWQNPIGGTVDGSVSYRGVPLYYTNATQDYAWETLANWNTASDGSGDTPTEAPWTGADGTTNGANLYDASGGVGVNINYHYQSSIDPNGLVTGTCDIYAVYNYNIINGGTWTNFFDNANTVIGGTFTGNNCYNEGGDIYGGTFTGNDFTNTSSGTIHVGTFTGNGFTNNGGGTIHGGTFEINGFTNDGGTIDYPNIQITSGGDPYTGGWLGQAWLNGAWNGIFQIGDLYYTNASEDGTWETLTNWNTSSDGSGLTPTEVPWTGADGTTNTSNLYDATDDAGVLISTGYLEPNSQTCFIDNVTSSINTALYGSTWSGNNFTNNGYIGDAPFTSTGDNFINGYLGSINGGTYTGNNMTNNGYINANYMVLCSGDNFVNASVNNSGYSGFISGGTFSNNGFTNQYGILSNATFTGTNFDNSYGIVANCDIRGGFNNVPNGFNLYNYVTSELAFAQIGQVFDTYFSGPSTGTTTGPLGPYYVYCDSIGAIQYPTPSGGGGGGIDISRLLGLPFFIKI